MQSAEYLLFSAFLHLLHPYPNSYFHLYFDICCTFFENFILFSENSVFRNINFTTPRSKIIVCDSGIRQLFYPNDIRPSSGLIGYPEMFDHHSRCKNVFYALDVYYSIFR